MTGNIPDWVKDLLDDEDQFWISIYPSYSFDERVLHWSGSLHRRMRWQEESGYDPYAIYSKAWHMQAKVTISLSVTHLFR
ncbi:hypothetical protein [Pseudochryseolinea flava]|uniref:Uncharacterized protein n=1 Tax=Pseudochryseolinea flava TaxID=2059302 RepID=A0A364XUH1_9BACT|nr:hypothetical protein [Pseudochryseolinea flava]RAV97975.1 hypothetical protein DQQ10_26250 [Pseudochryseolinea flava]